MKPKQLLTDEGGVSPVIGIVLMIAVTVILAAVIATYAFGYTIAEPAPTATFAYDYAPASNQLTVTHDSGAPIQARHLSVQGDMVGTCASSVICEERRTLGDTTSYNPASEFAAGNSFTVVTASDAFQISIVYNDGDLSAELGTYERSDT